MFTEKIEIAKELINDFCMVSASRNSVLAKLSLPVRE